MRPNERDGVSYQQPHDCLLKRLFRRRSKKTSKLRVTGLCVCVCVWGGGGGGGDSSVTGEFAVYRASNAEISSIWWRHHALHREAAQNHRWVIEPPSMRYQYAICNYAFNRHICITICMDALLMEAKHETSDFESAEAEIHWQKWAEWHFQI